MKFHADHSPTFISFTDISAAPSSSVIVITPVLSLIAALLDALLNNILSVSFPSEITSCNVTIFTAPVVAHAEIVSVPHVYV